MDRRRQPEFELLFLHDDPLLDDLTMWLRSLWASPSRAYACMPHSTSGISVLRADKPGWAPPTAMMVSSRRVEGGPQPIFLQVEVVVCHMTQLIEYFEYFHINAQCQATKKHLHCCLLFVFYSSNHHNLKARPWSMGRSGRWSEGALSRMRYRKKWEWIEKSEDKEVQRGLGGGSRILQIV
jgi:hypothetical protein